MGTESTERLISRVLALSNLASVLATYFSVLSPELALYDVLLLSLWPLTTVALLFFVFQVTGRRLGLHVVGYIYETCIFMRDFLPFSYFLPSSLVEHALPFALTVSMMDTYRNHRSNNTFFCPLYICYPQARSSLGRTTKRP